MKPLEMAAYLLGGAAVVGTAVLLRRRSSAAALPGESSVFGQNVLAAASADLGVTESGNPARVKQMLAGFGQAANVNWCAAAVGTWIHDASNALGVASPIQGSAGAKSTMCQFQNASNPKVGWIDGDALRANPSLVQPGMVVIWQRGAAGSWMGHIGVVAGLADASHFRSIEGNAGANSDRVVQSTHDLTAASLLGMGFFNDAAIFAGPGIAGLGRNACDLAPAIDQHRLNFAASMTRAMVPSALRVDTGPYSIRVTLADGCFSSVPRGAPSTIGGVPIEYTFAQVGVGYLEDPSGISTFAADTVAAGRC